MEKLVMDREAKDNKYLHRDFHSGMNFALNYIADTYGQSAVTEYLNDYAKAYFEPMTLTQIEKYLHGIYESEDAGDRITTIRTASMLDVVISSCPAVEFIRSKGGDIRPHYRETTTTLYKALAKISGLKFDLQYYKDENGASVFSFSL